VNGFMPMTQVIWTRCSFSKFAVLAVGLTAISALSGCIADPSQKQAPDYYAGIAQRIAKAPSMIVVSSCPLREEVSRKYFVSEEARLRTWELADASESYLRTLNLAPAANSVSMICGGLKHDSGEAFPVAESEAMAAQAQPMVFPQLLDQGALSDPTLAVELDRLFRRAYATDNMELDDHNLLPVVGLGLDRTQMARLRRQTGVRYIWLVSGDSVDYTRGKVVSTAILSTVFSLGMVMSIPQDGASTMVALVDLKEDRLVWKKRTGGLLGVVYTDDSYHGDQPSLMSAMISGDEAQLDTGHKWAADAFSPLLSAPLGAAVPQSHTLPAAGSNAR